MAPLPPPRLILASGSAGRRELLARLGMPFEVMPGHIDEPTGFRNPRHEVQAVSWLKAAAVAPRIEAGRRPRRRHHRLDQRPRRPQAGRRGRRPAHPPRDGRHHHELWTGVVLWRRPDDVQLVWQERSLVSVHGDERRRAGRPTWRRARGRSIPVPTRSRKRAIRMCASSRGASPT